MTPLVFATAPYEYLGRAIAAAGGWELGDVHHEQFPDGEHYCRIATDPADRDVIQARQGLAAWQQSQAASKASAQLLARMRRAYALGDLSLTDLLIAERQDFDIRRAELLARAGAHGAILQLMIDAHRIWSLGDDE